MKQNMIILVLFLYIFNYAALHAAEGHQAEAADQSFFKDPYIFEQQNISSENIETKILDNPASGQAVLDTAETSDVDFSFFRDPYAFDAFRNKLPVKAKISGYIQYSAWWDSRQNVEFGDGYLLLYPKNRELDANCQDINAQGEFNMTVIETRAQIELFGPKIMDAESFGYLEADIFGSDDVITRYRIRHAFLQLTWQRAKLLLGQFWHPMFVVKTFPQIVSFDGGEPFEPFARLPQFRLTLQNKKIELLLAATAQLLFTSNGPIGFSSTYQRNAMLPDFTVRIAHESKHNYGGIGANIMRLKPRLKSETCFKVNESITSGRFFAFDTLTFEPFELRTQLTYAQNGTNLALLGGYAVHCVNPTTDERIYANLRSINYWIDFNINRKIEPGLFIGVGKNLGSRKCIIQCLRNPCTGIEEKTIYSLSPEADQINTALRIAPRIRVHVLPIDFAAEIEYTRASYGCVNQYGKVEQAVPVANTRVLFTAYYFF